MAVPVCCVKKLAGTSEDTLDLVEVVRVVGGLKSTSVCEGVMFVGWGSPDAVGYVFVCDYYHIRTCEAFIFRALIRDYIPHPSRKSTVSDEPIRGLMLGAIIIVSANPEWIGGLEHRERRLK